MDSNGFDHWIKWWYNEVRSRSNGPWLLIMDNCGRHELDCTLPGVKIELLPPRCTAKYQPLDLGLIGHGKIRYRYLLLRMTLEVMMQRASHQRLGVGGIEQGCLPHAGDAIRLFDEAWSETARTTVIKCWMNQLVCLMST